MSAWTSPTTHDLYSGFGSAEKVLGVSLSPQVPGLAPAVGRQRRKAVPLHVRAPVVFSAAVTLVDPLAGTISPGRHEASSSAMSSLCGQAPPLAARGSVGLRLRGAARAGAETALLPDLWSDSMMRCVLHGTFALSASFLPSAPGSGPRQSRWVVPRSAGGRRRWPVHRFVDFGRWGGAGAEQRRDHRGRGPAVADCGHRHSSSRTTDGIRMAVDSWHAGGAPQCVNERGKTDMAKLRHECVSRAARLLSVCHRGSPPGPR